jgi:hypothetical protein
MIGVDEALPILDYKFFKGLVDESKSVGRKKAKELPIEGSEDPAEVYHGGTIAGREEHLS